VAAENMIGCGHPLVMMDVAGGTQSQLQGVEIHPLKIVFALGLITVQHMEYSVVQMEKI
jgi:hypothetical protein